MATTRKRRHSVFFESGLYEGDNRRSAPSFHMVTTTKGFALKPTAARDLPANTKDRPQLVRFRSRNEVHVVESTHDDKGEEDLLATGFQSTTPTRTTTKTTIPPLGSPSSPRLSVNESPLPEDSRSMMYRFGAALLFLAAAVPLLQSDLLSRNAPPSVAIQGVSGDEVPNRGYARSVVLDSRDDTQTQVCFRWAQQSAVVNGTMYLYGGQAMTDPTQTENTWNNDFLTLDLTESWQIDSPSLTGLPQPSGAPAVALGYLWSSYDSLFLYGGEFSWKPPVDPSPFALWQYQILDQSWTEHSDPVTSSGKHAPNSNVPVQRAAEGAGANVPTLGRGFYFGGHEDGYTTNGWSQSVPRIYLQSLLEFTFPGFANNQVSASTAGSDGIYRNITVGGLQADAGFTARADGLLIFVPGFGAQGILLALAGGTNQTFTQMNEINVYDIATSSWYTQSTSGPTPEIRVSPCAVAAAAPDGSSYNIYMFGGENLIPFGDQTQFSDMWILTVPAFTWIKVDQSGQSVPYGRSGASCQMWDGQMVVVGGYLGNASLSCEYPGIYVFDLSKLEWVQEFTASSPGKDDSTSDAVLKPQPVDFQSNGSNNPFNQQPAQIPSGLQGSYGYTVPQVVVSVIGGNANGGATITKPIVTATGGPLQTGSAQTYTVTNSAGSVVTRTASAQPGSSTGESNPSNSNSNKSSNNSNGTTVAAIVVGIVCGLLLLLSLYLLFCLYLYRRQLHLYKRHAELSRRRGAADRAGAFPGLWGNTSDVWEPSHGSDRNNEGKGFFNSQYDSDRSGNGSYGRLAADGSLGDSSSGGGGVGGRSGGRNGYYALGGAERGAGGGTGGGYGDSGGGRSSLESSTEDLLRGQEPTFVGVMLNPRMTLRVINRD